MCDFKKFLLKAIRQEFNKCKINGCFFDYVKYYGKSKKIRNNEIKNFRKYIKLNLIVFSLKLYPFILKKIKFIYY